MSKTVTTKAMARVAAVATGLAMVAGSLTFASTAYAAGLNQTQIQSILSLLQSFGADSATIANVNSALNGQATTGSTGGSTSASCSFSGDLQVGSTGAQVTCLQNALIAAGYSIPAGATGLFGGQTKAAVVAWQKAAGVSPASGYFGSISRAHWNLGGGTTSGGSTGGTVPVGSGNGLKVSLAATSPAGSVLVQGQGIGDIAEYSFANPTNSTVSVTGLTFNRIGVSNDATINNVYLYNGVNRLTDSAGVSNSQFSFNNPSGIFTLAPGQSLTIAVRADIAGSTAGQQLGVQLVSVASTGTLDSSDSFPINSGYQSISAATLATVSFSSSANTLPSGTPTVAPQTNYTTWQNSISVSQNPVWLKSMTFTNLGSIGAGNLSNFRLYVDGTQVGNAVGSVDANRHVVFDLSANPVKLSTQSHVVKVLADITGGSSLTFSMSLQRSSDALFIDSQLNQPITPTVAGANFSAVTAGTVTVQAVSGSNGISVSKDPNSASQAVSKGSTNVNWATFDFLSSGEPTKVNDLYVCANTETAGINGAGGGLANGRIYFNGVQVGSTKAIVECSPEGSSPTVGTDFSLGSSLVLPAGQTVQVSVYADSNTGVATSTTAANTNLLNGNTVQIAIVPATANAQGQNSLNSANVPAAAQLGTSVSIAAATLTASKFAGYANQTIIPGAQNALLGEFTLAAGSTEGVNVNTIGINASSTMAGAVQNLKLVDMSTGQQIGSTITTPSSAVADSPNSFSLGTALMIPASGSKTIGVYGNILSTASGDIGTLGVSASGTSGTGAVTNNLVSLSAAIILQDINATGGSLSVALGASNPVSSNVIAGASNLQAGDFTFNASNSSYTIQKLQVDVPNAVAGAVTSVSLQYKDVNGATQTATLSGASSVGTASTSYAFTGLAAFVPSNGQSDISVWVGTPTIASAGASISNSQISVTIDGGQNFQAQDQSGSLKTSFGSFSAGNGIMSNANTGYGTLVIHKSIPTFTMVQNPNATPAAGSSIYQFTISADPAGPVDVDQVSFQISTSTTILGTLTLYDITSGSAVSVASGVAIDTNGVAKFNFGANPQQIGAGTSKKYEIVPSTISSWATGNSVTIALKQDTTYVSKNASTDSSLTTGNIIWSDRSATSHTVSTTDWTNGYLLKDFVNDVTSYVHS